MKLLYEGIIFLTYISICASLIRSRLSPKAARCTVGLVLAAIILLQAVLLLAGQDETLVLTMLPVTAYLPFSVSLYLIAGYGFVQTMTVWEFGVFAVFILQIWKKILITRLAMVIPFPYDDLLTGLLLLLSAGLLVYVSRRFLRKPFSSCMEKKRTDWLIIFLPILVCLLLFSYFINSAVNLTVLILLLLNALFIFLIAIRLISSYASAERMKQTEQRMKDQMNRQFREYEAVIKSVESGRIYRHDMRHHLLVLEGLADQSDLEGIHRYIDKLQGRLLDTEHEVYCANSTVNAVLSPYIRQAKEDGCAVTAQINLPDTIPFDEMDVCMILANALENSIHACRRLSKEQDRYIHMKVELRDAYKLIISIKNPVDLPLVMDEDGVPVTGESEEHGIGLKSIRVIVDKYDGFFQCKCDALVFCFQAALFGEQQTKTDSVQERGPRKIWKKLIAAFGTSAVALVFFAGSMSVAALAQVGGYGENLRVYGKLFHVGWGDTSFRVDSPVVEQTGVYIDAAPSGTEDTETPSSEAEDTDVSLSGAVSIQKPLLGIGDTQAPLSGTGGTQTPPSESVGKDLTEGVDEMNRQIELFLEEAKERFLWYAHRKYEGYVQSDITWQTLRDDEALLVVRVEDTINAGGSGQYSRCFILDKKSGKMLELKDLFLEGSDYVEVISAEVLKQMTQQQQSGQGNYFIPGSIWGEEDWFREIAEDQNFYINDRNRLVIVFDEYEVAPGRMGMPEFVIDTGVLQKILKRPSVIS
ncbi:MAG: GHKL domain-containing protein [Lachnospiraceae bacterium]|nr:GHKL domain-containing protein [Lachnospiraceae bacterium]